MESVGPFNIVGLIEASIEKLLVFDLLYLYIDPRQIIFLVWPPVKAGGRVV